MRVLSLFDGISCAMVALERAGIPVEKYIAYEIEPNAIKISKKNYPQIEQCGDVMTADFDAMRGGTTCCALVHHVKALVLSKVKHGRISMVKANFSLRW